MREPTRWFTVASREEKKKRGGAIMRDFDLGRLMNILEMSEGGDSVEDNVNHPSHYTDGNIEVIDFIEDKGFGYCLGNAIKYISRAGKKDPNKTVEDLQKAMWYINHEIERIEKNENS